MVDRFPDGNWPWYGDDEIERVSQILGSGRVNYWTGTECRAFEEEFAAYHGVNHGVALANGTVALELALRILGIGPGDEVIVTPRSFIASVSCVVQVGAIPVFADVDWHSQNISAATIRPKITSKTKAILPVHLAGWPCDMPGIIELAREHDLYVIEDCAQAHGARIDGKVVGSFGDVAAFSFCQDKIISTAGEGGMLLTNDSRLWKSAWSYKDHGKGTEILVRRTGPVGYRWVHESIGSNLRMTEIQAAVGRLQLGKLDRWVEIRRRNAARLLDSFADIHALRIPEPPENVWHAYYKFYMFVKPELLRDGWSRDQILQEFERNGVASRSGSCPEIYRESAFAAQLFPELTVAHTLGETSLMFDVHPTLRESDVDHMIRAVRMVLQTASTS